MTSVRKHCHLSLRLDLPTPTKRLQLFSISVDHSTNVLSQLEKLQVLGHGNGGTVYKVRHKQNLAVYALKIMHGNTFPNTQELDILRQTNSPHVQCHQIFEKQSGEVDIHMEYMDAGTLDIYRKSLGRLSEDVIAIISRQVLKGFVYLCSKNIVHRDIMPYNLLINQKMEIKIADFGVSKIMGRGLSRCSSYVGTCAYMSPEQFDTETHGLSRCSSYVGTCAYMSPEQFDTETHGKNDGYAADVWSFGVTMMELYMGYCPYLSPGEKPDWPTLMLAICFGEPPSLPDCSSENFKDFIKCCLQKEPSKR